jgi:hypothetical protein
MYTPGLEKPIPANRVKVAVRIAPLTEGDDHRSENRSENNAEAEDDRTDNECCFHSTSAP